RRAVAAITQLFPHRQRQLLSEDHLMTNSIRFLAMAAALATVAACTEPTVPNLNNPTEEELATLTDRGQIQSLATGLLDSDRQTQFNYVFFPEMIARDILRLDGSDPRYIQGLLGAPNDVSPSGFLGAGVWAGPYATIRGANLFITAITKAGPMTPTPLSDKEKAAARGFAQALKAKVEMYRGFLPLNTAGPSAAPTAANLQSALTALDASFYNPVATRAGLDVGVFHTYTTGAGETVNPFSDRSVNYTNP